ncbi:MAG: TM2 domain-containing protein [Snowella sp.]|nr:TM2 domain-containing protein [Snowella sp.]
MKNRTVAALLALFLGTFGIHQFYLGQNTKGVLYLAFFWTYIPMILGVVDFVKLISMSDQAFAAKYNGLRGTQNNFIPSFNSSGERLDVAILKICSTKLEGATVTECVVETGADPQAVKDTLNQLCKQDLLIVSNRSSDHAVVYKPL